MKTDAQVMRKFDECMFLNKLIMVALGIWPIDRKASRLRIFLWKIQLCTAYFFLSFLLYMQWLDLYMLWGNVDANSETFLSNAFTFSVILKFSKFLKSMDLFRDILQTMRANWLHVMRDCELHNKNIMFNVTMRAHSHSIKYFFVTGSTALLYMIMPMLSDSSYRDRKYPLFGRFYFDRSSDIIYVVCYLSQVVAGSISSMASYVMDTMFLECTYHFCAQLRILQNDLMDLGYDSHRDVHERLASLIKRHQVEIRNAQALQSMFSQSSLQQVLLSCLMICTNGFQLIISLSTRNVSCVLYIMCQGFTLLQIFYYCQPGNELMVQSQSLGEAVYQSAWINMDKNTIQNVIFMIQRSQKLMAITAGKIYVLSLDNFMKIVKTSMSGLSVLRAIYQRAT